MTRVLTHSVAHAQRQRARCGYSTQVYCKPADSPGELRVVHAAHSCHEGSEGADDGNEPGEDNSLGAVLGIEILCLLQVLLSI